MRAPVVVLALVVLAVAAGYLVGQGEGKVLIAILLGGCAALLLSLRVCLRTARKLAADVNAATGCTRLHSSDK